VTTVSDPEGRQTVMELIKGHRERLYPVGRLDYGSEGLLLMTNDGELANKLTRASEHVPKTYEVKVSGRVPPEAIAKLRGGVFLPPEPGKAAKGVKTSPCEIRLLREAENPWYEITLVEGRNRQIRRMFEQVGHHVEKIKRVRFGPLVLNVETGEYRELSPKEVGMLKSPNAAQISPRRKPERQKKFSIKRAERQHAAWQKNKSAFARKDAAPAAPSGNAGASAPSQPPNAAAKISQGRESWVREQTRVREQKRQFRSAEGSRRAPGAPLRKDSAGPSARSPQRPSLGMTSGKKREFRGSETRPAASLRDGSPGKGRQGGSKVAGKKFGKQKFAWTKFAGNKQGHKKSYR
jgi:23S rRNA pseudouridine2605 synthase